MVQLRPENTDLPQPDQQFGAPARQHQGDAPSFEIDIQVTQRIESVHIDIADRNRVNDKPTKVFSGSIGGRLTHVP
jgi:hypothetical protein